jgi:MoaD family protein
MSLTVHISGFLTDFTGGERIISLEGSPRTVGEALDLLWNRHAGLRDRIVTERCQVRPHISLFVNGDHVVHQHGADTPLADGDELTILPAVSGG